jgi:oligopeptide/dipeptide ABC transporter ATP-binding protein
MATDAPYLVELKNVKKHFPVAGGLVRSRPRGWVRAVDGVSFAIRPGETFSLVGESGSGKTTTAKMVLGIEQPSDGSVCFNGKDMRHLSRAEWKTYRASVQAVFQDPWSSLDPRMRADAIIAEPLLANQRLSRSAVQARVSELLRQVGLHPHHAHLYPHQFSGGQRQRLAIARALSINPSLIVLDEPVSALDVSIRAQILNLLKDLQEQFGLSYLLIAHHLATVRYMSHQVGVMYLGQLVELAGGRELFSRPLHPYTKALYAAALASHPEQRGVRLVVQGDVPSPLNPPSGCRFHPRCPFAASECASKEPRLQAVAAGHWVRECPHVSTLVGSTLREEIARSQAS